MNTNDTKQGNASQFYLSVFKTALWGFGLGAGSAGSHGHCAVGEHGHVEAVEEHVLQPVQEVDVSHPWSVAAEHVGHLQENGDNRRRGVSPPGVGRRGQTGGLTSFQVRE